MSDSRSSNGASVGQTKPTRIESRNQHMGYGQVLAYTQSAKHQHPFLWHDLS